MKTIITRTAALALAVASAGCFSTWDVAPKSLTALNSYHAPQEVPIADTSGDPVAFGPGTELQFLGSEPARAKFASIRVDGSTFTGIARDDGRTVTVDLDHTMLVKAKRYSPVKTGLAIGIPVGVATILTVVGAVIAARSANAGDDTGDWSYALRRKK